VSPTTVPRANPFLLPILLASLAGNVSSEGVPAGTIPGTIVYSSGDAATGVIRFANGNGTSDIPITVGTRPRLSPDGNHLLFRRGAAGDVNYSSVWIRNLQTGTETRIHENGQALVGMDWLKDSSAYVYDWNCGIYRRNRDGTGEVRLFETHCWDDAPSVHPDGTRFVFHNLQTAGLLTAAIDGSARAGLPGAVANGNINTSDLLPAWSPDGTRLVAANGNSLVRIQADGSGRTNLLSLTDRWIAAPVNGNAIAPAWSPDGNWVVASLVVDGEPGIYAVASDGSGAIRKVVDTAGRTPADWVGSVAASIAPQAVQVAELGISSETPGQVPVSRPSVLGFQVRNEGSLTATNTTVTIPVPAGLDIVSATVTSGTAQVVGREVRTTVSRLAAGGSIRLQLTVVPTVPGIFEFVGTVAPLVPDGAFNNTTTARLSAAEGFSGSVELPGQIREYSFRVAEGAPHLYVFDALTDRQDLAWRLVSDRCGNNPEQSFIFSDGDRISDIGSVLELTPGEHRIQVRANDGGTGIFAFNLLRLADAPLLTVGAVAAADLVPGNSTRTHQFSAVAGDRMRVRLSHTNAPGLRYRVVDPYGRVLEGGYGEGSPFVIHATGNHFLLVEGNITRGAFPGSYGIEVRREGFSPIVTATSELALGTAFRITNSAPFTNSWRFTLPAAARLAFTPLEPNSRVRWQWVGPKGPSDIRRFVDDNWYLFDSPAGEYQLTTWSTDSGEQVYAGVIRNLASAPVASLDTEISVTNTPANDDRFLRVPLLAGQSIHLGARTQSGFIYGATWALFDPSLQFARNSNCNELQGGFNDLGVFTAPSSGEYLLGLGSYVYEGATEATRVLRISGVTNRTQTIALGELVTGTIETSGQVRTHRFDVDVPRRVSLDLMSTENANWRLVGPSGDIGSSSFASDGWRIFDLVPGEHALVVTGRNSDTPPYRFRLLDLASGPVLAVGSTSTNTISPANSSIVRTVNLAAGRRLFLEAVSNSAFPRYGVPYWTLVAPDGSQVFDTSFRDSGVFVTPQAGAYRLLIGGGVYEDPATTGVVVFRLNEVADTTTSLALDTPVDGAVGGPGAVNRYTFNAAGPLRISIDPLTNSPARFSLEGPAGNVVQGSFNSDSWWIQDLIPGAYTLSVFGSGNATPSYRFQVVTAAAGPLFTVGTTNQLSFDSGRATRFARYNLTAGQRLIADVVDRTGWTSSRPAWRLIGPNGVDVFDQSANLSAPWVTPVTGTYTLAVGGALWETGEPSSLTWAVRESPSTGVPLALGATVAGRIDVPGQQVVYGFQVATAGLHHFDSLANSSLNWRIDGPEGYVAGTTFSNDQPWAWRFVPGDYTVTVFGSGETVGGYAFRMLALDSAPALALGTETSVGFQPPNGAFAYSIELSAGQTLTNRFLGLSNLVSRPVWAWIDPSGRQLVHEGLSGTRTFSTRLPGRHALLLLGGIGESATNASFRFQVDNGGVTPLPAYDGSPLAFDSIVEGSLADSNQTNAFTFSLSAPTFIGLDVLTNTTARWQLRNRDGLIVNNETLTSADWDARTYRFFMAEQGDYQLVVRGPGPFRFRLMRGSDAPLIALDTDIRITNSPAISASMRRFRGTAGQTVRYLGQTAEGWSQRPLFTVFRPSGGYFQTTYVDSTPGAWTLTESGEYLMLFGGPETETSDAASFGFRLHTVRTNTSAIAFNTPVHATIPGPNGTVSYTFRLNETRRLLLDTLTNASVYYTLRRPDQIVRNNEWLPYADIDSNPASGAVPIEVPAGDYTLSFENAGNVAAPEFDFVLWDVDAVARPITPGILITSTNTPANASALYRFEAAAGDAFVVDGRNVDGYVNPTYVDWFQPLRSGQDLGTVQRMGNPFTVTHAGNQFLHVSSSSWIEAASGVHQFVLWDLQDTESLLTLGEATEGAIVAPGTRSVFRFQLAADALLLVDNLRTPSDPVYHSLSSDDSDVYTDRTLQNVEWSFGYQLIRAEAGLHRLAFRMGGADTNNFRFRVIDATGAPSIGLGSSVEVRFPVAQGTEVRRFSANAGDRFFFRSLSSVGFTDRPYARIYAQDGTLVWEAYPDRDRDTQTLPRTGNYFVVLNSFGHQAGVTPVLRFQMIPVTPVSPEPLFETSTSPDLQVTAVTPSPATTTSGGQVEVRWTVRNAGDAAATNAFNDRIVIRNSEGAALVSRVAGDARAPLALGSQIERTATLRLPEGVAATGNLEVTVTADAADSVAEANASGTGESNNSRTAALVSTFADYPDLVVRNLSATPSSGWLPTQSVTLRWAVTNIGLRSASGPWTAQVVVSNTARRLTLLTTEVAFPTADLAPGTGTNRTVTFSLPDTANVYGALEVRVLEDAAGQLAEYNLDDTAEANNAAGLQIESAPDLAVVSVLAPAFAEPGVPFQVITLLTNRGTVALSGTWQNALSVSLDASPGDDTLLQTESITATIPAGGSLRRTNSVAVPELGDAGTLRLVARADIGNAIPESDEDNNTGIAATTTTVPLRLGIRLNSPTTREDAGVAVAGTVSRNGTRTAALTVLLSNSDPTELTVPNSVVIPAGQTTVAFEVTPRSDEDYDGPVSVSVGANAAGFEGDATTITVLDDDVARLVFQVAATNVVEGRTLAATVSRIPASATPLTVQLTSADSSQLSVPGTVTIPAGESQRAFTLNAVEDTLVERTNSYTVTAAAAGFAPASVSVSVEDNDRPAVSLSLTSRTVSEGAGPNATTATLTRSPVTSRAVTVAMVSGDPNAVRVPTSVVIPANGASVSFPVAAVDNAIVDGSRVVTLGGSVLDSVTGSAVAEIAPDVLTVTDNDGPTLIVFLEDEVVPEGRSPATRGSVLRNTSTESTLTVNLASSVVSEARVPASVTIPAGTNRVDFEVASVNDGVSDGNRTVTITATAPGFTTGTTQLVVSDADRPDLVVSRIQIPAESVTGGQVAVAFRVENRGVVASTNPIVQRAYLSSDNVLGNDTLAAQITHEGAIAAGGFIDQTLNLRLPDQPGAYYVILQADSTDRVVELLENNNTRISDTATVSGPSYNAVVSTTAGTVLPGTVIPLSGTATRVADGSPARSVPVVIHLRVRGFSRTIRATTDANGRFAGEFLPLPSEAGHYEIAAAYPGLPMPAVQDDFTILGVDSTGFGTVTVVEGSNVTATSQLRNLADQALTGVGVSVVTNHPSVNVTARLGTNRLGANATTEIEVLVTAVNTTAARSTAILRITTTEGVSLDLVVPIQQERLTPRLTINPGRLEQPMLRGRSTTVTFAVRNDGGADTGPLDVLIPGNPWLSLASPGRLDSLPPGSNTVVTLRLNPPADLPLGDYPGTVALNSRLAAVAVPFEFRCTSDGRGELHLVAEDEYTYFAAGGPRLTNALVVLREALGGASVATNRTDADGQVLFTNLVEAYYLVDVTADGHTAFRQSALVPAGGRTNITAFLPRETVRYNFTVTPTTVEDRYSIEIESIFETQVPMPVVTITPASLDIAQFPGEEFQVEFTIENHGLINAENLVFDFPQGESFTVTPLITDLGTLAARTSIRVPAIIRRLPAGGAGAGDSKAAAARFGRAKGWQDGRCSVTARMLWEYLCGPNVVNRQTASYVFDSTGCDLVDLYFQVYELVPLGGGTLTTDEFADYLDELQPVLGFEAPPGYEFRCRTNPPPASLTGPKVATGISSKSRRTGLPFWETPKAGNETCARVRLRIDQRAVLTRDAFNARLEMENDTDEPIENLFITLDVRNVNGETVTTRFGIREPELAGITGVGGAGTLGTRATGTASWIIIPTLDAAPTNGEAFYLVGGTMTYRQGGLDIAVPLAPAPIRVFPQPELQIRYFHDRDVFADDPFTDEIEPSIPYSLVAQVNNVGYGDARNLVIEGGEPQIIDNEKGLLIEFITLGAQVEERLLAPSLRVDLGAIPAGSNRVGRWVFTSSLQGSFTNFTANFRHLDALGVERLSLLRSVEIHELSHIVQDTRLNPDGRADFLANDVPDPGLVPDTLYLSDGRVMPVVAGSVTSVGPAPVPGNLRVTVAASMPAGWGYLRLQDPGAPEHVLTRVLREDGSELAVGTNAWTTDRFIFGGDIRPVRTNLVHLVDYASTGRYTLVYETVAPVAADVVPPVSTIDPLPAQSPSTFQVRWSSSDEGTGTAFYDLYVSDNGGPFRPWLERTSSIGGIFLGEAGHSYGFYVRATDQAGNVESRSATAMQSTTVSVVNTPPALDLGGDVTLDEGALFARTIVVSDADAGQAVSLELLPGAPAGLLFDAATGSMRWQTTDGDGPATREVRIRATDNGSPAASVTRTLAITVREANQPPRVTALPDFLITERFPLELAVEATDDDRPAQTLSYSLLQGPTGSTLDPATGLFAWRPRGDQGPSTNLVRVRVADSGTPAATSEIAFTVYVRDTTADLLVAVGSTNVLNGQSGSLPLGLNADPGITNVSFRLPLPPGALASVSLGGLAPDVLSATLSELTADGVTVRLELASGTSLTTDRHVADFRFTTVPGDASDLFVVNPTQITGIKAAAEPVASTLSRAGTLILIGREPVLQLNGADSLTVYGRPGTRFQVQTAPDLNGPWTPVGPVQIPVDGRWSTSTIDILDPVRLLRVIGL
jgi:uncharacterized repeat protein (TIGR01451 family)